MIRVMVVDHDRAFRHLVAGALESATDDIRVVGVCGRGDRVVETARETEPDVVLMNVNVRGGDGFEATRWLLADRPDCRVVIVTAMHDLVDEARAAGAVGYLRKDCPLDDMLIAVRVVAAGRTIWPGPLPASLSIGS